VPEETKAHETEIYKAQIAEDPKLAGKPAQVIDGVVRGKLGKYYKEVCLADQTYFRDDKLSIAQYVASVEKELGSPIKVVDFYRFAKGEDIEKKQDDFVAEVAKMVQ
jgi:elongation factor Ts